MRVSLDRARWWWWNLPLSRKGWVVVGAPLLVLVPTVIAAMALNIQQDRIRADVRDVRARQLLSADVQQHLLELENSLLAAAVGDADSLASFGEADEHLDEELETLAEGGDETLAGPAVDAARAHLGQLWALRDAVGSAAAPRDLDLDLGPVAATSVEVGERFAALETATAAASNDGRDQIDRLSALIVGLLISGILFAAAAAILMTRLFTRSIVKRVTAVNEVTTKVLDGDFTLELDDAGRDELGVLFEKLRQAGALLIAMNDDMAALAAKDRARLERERLMREMLGTVHREVGRAGILEAVVRELSVALDADRALVMAVEDEQQLGPIIAEWATERLTPLGLGQRLPSDPRRDGKVARLLAERRTMIVDTVATTEELLPQTREVLGQLGVGSLLLAPVVTDNEALGVLVLLTTGRSRPWPAGTGQLLDVVANELATALVHARLLEREREMVERLRELDQTRADFVASVSHELRTPLTSIRGYCEMLEDGDGGELTPGQLQMLGVVQRNADRLLLLIEDLLTLSRIESGSFRVVLSPTDLGALVCRTIDELRPQAAGQGVHLDAQVDDDLPLVLGDAQQLERILLNLVSNAIKFTPDGGDVDVRLTRRDDDLVLEVSDHGIGIPDAELPHLFGRFFRSSTAQDRAIQGTGLGLVIVKSIVDHHNGRIDARSTLGEGTTFTVRIPVTSTAEHDRESVGVA